MRVFVQEALSAETPTRTTGPSQNSPQLIRHHFEAHARIILINPKARRDDSE